MVFNLKFLQSMSRYLEFYYFFGGQRAFQFAMDLGLQDWRRKKIQSTAEITQWSDDYMRRDLASSLSDPNDRHYFTWFRSRPFTLLELYMAEFWAPYQTKYSPEKNVANAMWTPHSDLFWKKIVHQKIREMIYWVSIYPLLMDYQVGNLEQ